MHLQLTFLVILSLQCSHYLTSVRGNPRIRSSHKIITEIIELKEGTVYPHLNCSTIINGSKVKVYWKKDGELIQFGSRDYFPIYYVSCKHDGNYTCFTYNSNSTVVILKEFVVKVTAQATQDVCGKAGKVIWQKSEICIAPTIHDYPCCKYPIPSPRMLHLNRKISSKIKSKCKLDTIQNPAPWEIDVRWNIEHNATWIWGWQVSLTGLDNNLGVQSCVQINSKNLLNWTFDGLPFGGKYEIKVQALLSNFKNYIVKNIILPKKKDICKTIGRKCHWEKCFPVQDVQQEKTTSVLTWHPSKYHKAQHDQFEIYYNSSDINCTDSGRRKVENTSRIGLDIHKCRRYHVKVRSIFSNAEEGIFSEEIVFFPPRKPTGQPSIKPTTESYTDVIVSCSIALALLILGLIAVIIIKRKRKDVSNRLIVPPLIEPEVIPNPSIQKTEVFIVHDNHCRECNNVTHSLANLLNKTGHLECTLDFCCMNEITGRGMGWYEDNIRSCDKVIVVCTKDGKRMYDEKEQKKDGAYIFNLNMLLGQMIHHQNRNLKIVPVYFDISSHEDIPFFLSEHACYSLPSHIEDLYSALRSEDHLYSDSSIYGTSNEMTQAISKLKDTIEIVGRDHKGYKKLKVTETTSL